MKPRVVTVGWFIQEVSNSRVKYYVHPGPDDSLFTRGEATTVDEAKEAIRKAVSALISAT